MKKLIYGLGAIAATVTPVVAVVSCGKEEAKAESKLGKAFAEKGFTIDASKLAELEKFVGKYETLEFKPGKLGDEGHSATDYVVLVKGTPEKLTKTLAELNTPAPIYAEVSSAPVQDGIQDDSPLAKRWGLTNHDFETTRMVIYLQHRAAGATLEAVHIVESSDHKYLSADVTPGKFMRLDSKAVTYKAVKA